jgi:DNA-binding MarR family transcriptional regulator
MTKKMVNSKRLEDLLARVHRDWEADDPKPSLGITGPQLSLLLSLSENPGCRVQDTAHRLDLTAPTISIGVRRLETLGLVQRDSDPDDQRAVCLYLSAQGRRIATKARAQRAVRMERMLATLSDDEQEALLGLLERALTVID